MRASCSYGGDYIFNNNHEKTEYNKICSQSMDKAMKRFCTNLSLVLLSFVVSLCGPLYAYINDGTRSTLFGCRVPFTEKGSNSEFMVLVILQGIAGYVGLTANTGLETAYCLHVSSVWTSTKLIKSNINNLSRGLEANTLTNAEIRYKLSRIFDKINHSDK